MNLFFLILAIIVFLYFLRAIISYKEKKLIITVLFVIGGIIDIVLFL